MTSALFSFTPPTHLSCDWFSGFMEEHLRSALHDMVDPINNEIKSAGTSLSQLPADFFGKKNWNFIQSLCASFIFPIALTILSFCLAFELYHIAERNNGSFDIETVATTCIKFIIPFFMITHCYDILYSIALVMSNLMHVFAQKLSGSPAQLSLQIDEIMTLFKQQSGWGQVGFYNQIASQIGPIRLFMWILAIAIYFVIVGRIFEIAILWLFSPIPTAFLVSSEERRVGVTFYKTFFAVLLQGFIMLVVLYLYSFTVISFNKTTAGGATSLNNANDILWKLVGISIVLAGTLVGTGKVAKSLVNAF